MFKGQIFKLKCNKSSNALHLQFPKDIVKHCRAMNNEILSEEDHELLWHPAMQDNAAGLLM